MFTILRIILIIVVIRAVWMLLRGMLEGAGYGSVDSASPSVKLVRDPICGVYVMPNKAITARSGVGVAYFCSEKCRKQWEKRSA